MPAASTSAVAPDTLPANSVRTALAVMLAMTPGSNTPPACMKPCRCISSLGMTLSSRLHAWAAWTSHGRDQILSSPAQQRSLIMAAAETPRSHACLTGAIGF